MHQYGLALHTTSPILGLCLSNFVDAPRIRIAALDRDISTHLHQYLLEFLPPQNWQDLQFLAVAKGPGSFTGTRIGVATARTISQQLQIPLWGISTLEAMVWTVKDNYSVEQLIPVAMPARRGQLFVGIYRLQPQAKGLEIYLPDTTMTPDTWTDTLKQLENLAPVLTVSPKETGMTVLAILELAYLQFSQGKVSDWSEVLPFYGQSPV